MRTTLAVPIALLSLVLTACGDSDDGDDGDRDTKGAVPERIADLDWDVDDSTSEADACGQWVTWSDFEEPFRIIDVEKDTVVLPQVSPPSGSKLEPTAFWTMNGGCITVTGEEPVVVIETQAPFLDISNPPPKLVAGLRPNGDPLWSREVPGGYLANYDGRGAVVLDELGPEAAGWLVLDAKTGETVAEGKGEDKEPTVAVAHDQAATISNGVLRFPSREVTIPTASVAHVQGEQLLAQTGAGVELVGINDGTPVWTRPEVSLVTLWRDGADLSTGVAVVRNRDGFIVGLDLATGKERWTSSVPRKDVNSTETDIGSGVLVARMAGNLDEQVLIDTETGERLPDPDGFLILGQEFLLLVDDEGVPRRISVDDLRA